jgi:23S rRNA pseudouridine1911/1915/1917 synthase
MTDSVTETVTIAAEEAGQRIDRVLAARIPALSRSRLKALILDGQVTVEARTIRDPAAAVNSGNIIVINLPPPEEAKPKGEKIPLKIVYEDDDLIVIDKPAGLVVHPSAGHATGTLVNALIAHCGDSLSGIGGVKRPGIVHRLDKDTSGLLVVAKNDRAHKALSKQFADHGREGPHARFQAEWALVGRPESAPSKNKRCPDAKPVPTFAGRRFERGYLAFVWGAPDRPKGTIDAPLDRNPKTREKRAVRAGGREAITHWQLLETFNGQDSTKDGGKPVASLLACTLETGRTHQIRVHLAHIGHPILGDATYGTGFKTKAGLLGPKAQAALAGLGRQALHAYLLAIEHPDARDSAEILEFQSELPGDLRRLHDALAAESSAARSK